MIVNRELEGTNKPVFFKFAYRYRVTVFLFLLILITLMEDSLTWLVNDLTRQMHENN
jgi:hypothetical protein